MKDNQFINYKNRTQVWNAWVGIWVAQYGTAKHIDVSYFNSKHRIEVSYV